MANNIIISANNLKQRKAQYNPAFTSKSDIAVKCANGFVKSQENLKITRFIQDVTTNWLPKVVFARSLPDFAEMSFLEYTESALFYFAPAFFGKIFKKTFSKFHPEELKNVIDKNIPKSAHEILSDKSLKKSEAGKRTLSTKAAIILACTIIPAGEYALSFAKNLFTLKLFKKSDFNNIANLNKEQKEDKDQQERVRNSAYKHIKNAGLLSVGGLGASLALLKYGHKSEPLQKASKLILQPGAYISKGLDKVGLHSDKTENFLKKYITPDFDGKDGKLTLSKGQLLVSTLSGFFGYSSAGKDRGKLDQLEVWTRVPLVVFYTVFGSSIFDHAFKKILINKNKFPELIKKAENKIAAVPTRAEIKKLAIKFAKQNGTDKHAEFSKLIKQKAFIVGVPYAFSLLFMGFLLAGITRFWTQYRYNHGIKQSPPNTMFTGFADAKRLEAFDAFKY